MVVRGGERTFYREEGRTWLFWAGLGWHLCPLDRRPAIIFYSFYYMWDLPTHPTLPTFTHHTHFTCEQDGVGCLMCILCTTTALMREANGSCFSNGRAML